MAWTAKAREAAASARKGKGRITKRLHNVKNESLRAGINAMSRRDGASLSRRMKSVAVGRSRRNKAYSSALASKR